MRWHTQCESWHKVTGLGQMWFVNWSKPPHGKSPIHSDECSELHNAQALRPHRLTRTLSCSPDTGASTAEVEVEEHFSPKYMTRRDRRETAYSAGVPSTAHLVNWAWIYAIKNRTYETKNVATERALTFLPQPVLCYFWASSLSIFNAVHQHRLHKDPDSHANKNSATHKQNLLLSHQRADKDKWLHRFLLVSL